MMSEAEKARISPSLQSVTQEDLEDQTPLNGSHRSRYQRWAGSIKGLEARGIEPIPVEERLKTSPSASFHMLLMWFSMGMALNNMVVGSLGTLVMKLSFADAALCAIFGNLLGGMAVGYMSTWGPRSGNPLAWAPLAADYYVYYPPTIRRWRTWSMTTMGGCLAMIITLLLGVGLGSGVAKNPKWAETYDGTPASLLMAGYGRLGGFGKFCAFINVVTVVSSNAPGSYSMAMNFQMLGNVWSKIPRPVFTVTTTVIYTACAIGGRDFLYEIFKSFLPLIGYWIIIWFTIVAEEDLLFRRSKGYDWSAWNCRQKLPVGVAAALAFLVGWAGAIVGMV
ncbi:unnamed protein product [Aspergillus oryzae]|uniref:Unnamed protein product n=1 Tax=Aspergillus oryzae TaxID=5062 RepID=A0AAN5BVF5_ASPOZ|nr:unnamed protein product [Aspergillus oryzae]GMF93327.1 unnamed protein product [Aspergillus oryzae]GMG05589.1 unnamed protein product [Aspergillus oryzae]GMG28165.1 unnamed protein product [Aspergillus oryzae]